jgi:hypothetical protein
VSQRLERRYQRLLRLYPKGYREERGAEMFATFMDAAESGRARPARREVAALVVGGLRVRAGAVATSSPGWAWLSALRVAAVLLVAHAAAQSAAHAGRIVFSELLMGRGLTPLSDLGHPAALVAGVLTLAAIARGRYWLGVILAAVTFALGQWAMSWLPFTMRLVDGEFWQLPLAIVLTLPLLWRRPAAAGRPLAWLLAIPLSLLLLPTPFDDSLHLQPIALLVVCIGCLAWSMIDARASIAGGALLLGPILSLLGFYLPGWANGRDEHLVLLSTYLLFAVALVGVGATLFHRQARL